MFVTRLLSGIVLLAVAILTMSYGNEPLLVLLMAISLIAFRELTKALHCAKDVKKINGLEAVGMAGIVAYYASVYYVGNFEGSMSFVLMAIVGTFLAEMFLYVIKFPKYRADRVVAAVFAFLYAPVMLSFIYLTRSLPVGVYTVWLILISSWGCDTCAYVVGKLIGKKKIFPVLSPHKSLEGCIGGVLGAALIGAVYGHFMLESVLSGHSATWMVAVICALGAIMSMVGDLAASAIKRNNDIKDYGKIIPGHGGIMDRFDSVIVTAPMVYFLTILLLRF